MPSELEQFFASYLKGFDTFDASLIASHYRLPANILDGDGLCSYLSEDELRKKFSANCKSFKEMGYQFASFEIEDYKQTGPSAAIVTLAWRVSLFNACHDFMTSYVCMFSGSQWQIISAVAYEK